MKTIDAANILSAAIQFADDEMAKLPKNQRTMKRRDALIKEKIAELRKAAKLKADAASLDWIYRPTATFLAQNKWAVELLNAVTRSKPLRGGASNKAEMARYD